VKTRIAPATTRGAHSPGSGDAGSTGQVGPATALPCTLLVAVVAVGADDGLARSELEAPAPGLHAPTMSMATEAADNAKRERFMAPRRADRIDGSFR
jgi:hypothetical protein